MNVKDYQKELIVHSIKDIEQSHKISSYTDYGSLEINKYSLTFWVRFIKKDKPFFVYFKIPKIVENNKELLKFDKADISLAEEEFNSLEYLNNNWPSTESVSFAVPLTFIEKFNLIITERIIGKHLFLELRKPLINLFQKEKLESHLSNLGRSLSIFHSKHNLKCNFELKEVTKKFQLYISQLSRYGVNKINFKLLEKLLNENNNFQDSSFLTLNLKGFDVRQIFVNEKGLFIIDPGKIKKSYFESDLARFIVTLRIINWGSISKVFHLILSVYIKSSYEKKFLKSYYGKKVMFDKKLSFLIIKEILKHWIMAHKSIDQKPIPKFLKKVIRLFYLNIYFKNLLFQEIKHFNKHTNKV
tara:strand:+ start:51 stop:1121 length:1071 start_codon:yes stop_codon:yes gene_type:complete